jgi:ribonuclease P protein component
VRVQRKFRLTRSLDFKRVRRSGKSFAHPYVVLLAHVSESQKLRVGVTAGRSVGGAVNRNKAKRLLREAIRPLLPGLQPGWDLVLVARSAILTASLTDIRPVVKGLLEHARIVAPLDES